DSILSIAKGAIGGAAAYVEATLAKAVPLVISFLASLLGLGGISDKIRGIIEKIQEPVNEAIDWVIKKAVDMVKAVGKMLGFGKKDEKPDERTPEQKQADLDAGLNEADAVLQDKLTPLSKLQKQLIPIKHKYRMTSLDFAVVSEDNAEGEETVQAVG